MRSLPNSLYFTRNTGASTVSLDLDKKWLDRIRPQMEANGITEWDGKHDCIYGDVSGHVSCGTEHLSFYCLYHY